MLIRGLSVLLIATILSGVEWYLVGRTDLLRSFESLPETVEVLILLNVTVLNVWLSNSIWRFLRGAP